MTYECITTRTEGDKVDVITLNRPKALNSLSPELVAEVAKATAVYDADPSTGCIVITGSGQTQTL